MQNNSGAVITSGCSEQEIIAACKLLNYGFTQDGILYWNYGTEGVSYTINAEGKPVFTDTVMKHPLGATEAFKLYTGAWSAGVTVQQLDMVYQKNAPEAVEAVQKWMKNTISREKRVPSLLYAEEDRDALTDLESKVDTYIEEMALKFVTGQESLDDANWNAYKKQVKDYGEDKMMQYYRDAYKEYKNRELKK